MLPIRRITYPTDVGSGIFPQPFSRNAGLLRSNPLKTKTLLNATLPFKNGNKKGPTVCQLSGPKKLAKGNTFAQSY